MIILVLFGEGDVLIERSDERAKSEPESEIRRCDHEHLQLQLVEVEDNKSPGEDERVIISSLI